MGGGSVVPEPVVGLLDARGIRDSVTGIADAASGLVNNVESAIDILLPYADGCWYSWTGT